jgi:GNAT superfamily N-acetyltransferase
VDGGSIDVRSAHRNHQAFWRQLARVCDGAALEVPGGLLVATGGRVRAGPWRRTATAGPMLTMPVDGAVPPPETPLIMTTAGDVADLRAFVDCAAAGYRMDPALLKPVAHRRALADDSLRFHLGRIDGRCVAVSVGLRCAETIGGYFVAVRRGYRRRGFGAAITSHAIQDGGVGTAVLQVTSPAYPLYVGMGFTKVADHHLCDLPAGQTPTP